MHRHHESHTVAVLPFHKCDSDVIDLLRMDDIERLQVNVSRK